MIKFKCSQCNEDLEAPSSMIGERLQCPKCRFPGVIPDMPSQPGPAPISVEGFFVEEDNKPITLFPKETEPATPAVTNKSKRSLITSAPYANHVKTFHARLSDKAMEYLDELINEWLEKNPEFVIKFSNTTVGIVEGKKSEPHLIITVWY